jgi:competence protein ComEC
MKLPALLIALSVAAGVLAASPIAARANHAPGICVIATLACIAAGLFVLTLRRTNLAWALALLAWFFLAGSAAQIEHIAIPGNQLTALVSKGELDLQQPLRWRGILRADPLRLPWGIRYDIDLQQVQTAGEWRSVHGGLRASYFFDRRIQGSAPAVRAGDLIELLVRARVVRNFGDPGAFDYRGALRQQGIDVTATLRNPALLQLFPGAHPRLSHYIARVRGSLLNELDTMLASSDDRRAIARAMLLGDRSFLDSQEADSFRETGAFHVLVIAGLHVGVLAAFLFWAGKKVRLPLPAQVLLTIAALCFYLGIVEDRAPIVRAALMAVIYLLAQILYRRVALLNVVSLAAIVILLLRPSEIMQASFQLSFLAAAIIAGIGQPLLERSAEPYRRALDHLGDITRDGSHAPRLAEFRLDLRASANWLRARLPAILARYANDLIVVPCRAILRLFELAVLSVALQIGMLPLMARDFHRVSFVAPLANIPAVLLTGVIVPFGFGSLAVVAIWHRLGLVLGRGLGFLIALLAASVHWFARFPAASMRVPSPPPLLLIGFFAAALIFSIAILMEKNRE